MLRFISSASFAPERLSVRFQTSIRSRADHPCIRRCSCRGLSSCAGRALACCPFGICASFTASLRRHLERVVRRHWSGLLGDRVIKYWFLLQFPSARRHSTIQRIGRRDKLLRGPMVHRNYQRRLCGNCVRHSFSERAVYGAKRCAITKLNHSESRQCR